jgi:thiosulfate/3-mercaptopyruvate sulfurtransferase
MVLYDSGRLIDAARFFWVLEVYGHSKVSILDGGLAHWQKEKQPVQIAATTRPRSVYIPNISSRHLSNQLTTRLAMTKTKVSIIDARSSDDYSGKTSKAKRFGHIPTAINVPWSQNYQVMGDHMMLRPDNELEEIYSNQDTKSDVIAYCNRGKQSALTYFVLRKLGYNVSVYDGAWLEWGNDDSLPISSMRAYSDGSL